MRVSEAKMNKIAGIATTIVGLLFIFVIIPTQIDTVQCDWYNSPKFFPYAVSILLTILGVTLVINSLLMAKKVPEEKQDVYQTNKEQFKMVAIAFLIMVAYTALLDLVGYIPCTIIMLVGMMRFCGQKSWVKVAIIAVALTLAIYFGFSKLLYLRMP